MIFLGNRPAPLHHETISAALRGLDQVGEDFAVPGVEQRFVREWLARCWMWRGRPRVFYRPGAEL